MKIDDKLITLIKNKKFKTFWHCIVYLLDAGYNNIDAFAIALKEFEGVDLFKNIAFGRIMLKSKGVLDPMTGHYDGYSKIIIIGFIDETNIHLEGLYKIYRESLMSDSIKPEEDIENTCEVLKINGLNDILLTYLIDNSKKHFGKPLFILEQPKTRVYPDLSITAPRMPHIAKIEPDHDELIRLLKQETIKEAIAKDSERKKGDIWM